MPDKYSYILFNKPYLVLSQFTSQEGKRTLSEFGFPKGVYAAGRLDYDSEGLLILTNDGPFKHRLTDPKYGHERTYLAQVERVPDKEALKMLERGVFIGGYKTKPCRVELLKSEPDVPPREPPIRFRKNVPTAWLRITLQEGRNRQVRRMTAAVGHPTLRLIRIRISHLSLDGLKTGQWRYIRKKETIIHF